jgi:hypothetical protein
MTSKENPRFPKSALNRYSELLLRHVYQTGGRERYVPVKEIEDALGLEFELIEELCRTRLLGEIQMNWRLPAELEESVEAHTPLEREWLRDHFSRLHLRIRPEPVRMTEEELLDACAKRKKKQRKSRG